MFSLVACRSRCLSVSTAAAAAIQRAAAVRWASTLVVSEPLLESAAASPGTQATVTAAQKLNDNSIDLLVVGDTAPTMIPSGVSRVLHCNMGGKVVSESIAAAMEKAHSDNGYSHILAPSSKFGSTIVPRAAALLDLQPVTDVLEVIKEGTKAKIGCMPLSASYVPFAVLFSSCSPKK
jgi:electron transfer flavoprotein alpha subunit